MCTKLFLHMERQHRQDRVLQSIQPQGGEEIAVGYDHKKGQLKRIYSFKCQCGGRTEWGSWGSVGSSSWTGSEIGEGEKKMGSLDAIVEKGMDGRAATEALDAAVEKAGAIELRLKRLKQALAGK